MHSVAIAFTGAALFIGGLGISPAIVAERPQVTAPGSIYRIAMQAGWCFRFSRSFQPVSPSVLDEMAETISKITPSSVSGAPATTSRRKFSERFAQKPTIMVHVTTVGGADDALA